jgi:poly-gamma-glutamate synthesis protein (capsule biosynthesis protein)
MKQRNQKHIALLSVVLVPALLLSACGSGASGQLSSSSTAPGSEPAVSVSQPEPEPQPAVTALRFSATGDNLIHDGLYLQARSRAGGEGYDFTALYENVAPFYKDFDINWINQETLVTDELPPSSYPCFCTPGALGRAVYDVGWRVISMSNNHSYDKGAQGIAATLRFWDDMPDDVVTTGLYAGEADYGNIPIQEKEGVRIAYLAYTETRTASPRHPMLPPMLFIQPGGCDPAQIELARQQADIVLWVYTGVLKAVILPPTPACAGQKIADWGADVIIGTHRMSSSPWSAYRSRKGKTVPIAYSLGNFVSTQAAANNMVGVIPDL